MSDDRMSQIELQLLQQITKSLQQMTARLEGMDQIQRETLERLVRVEERSLTAAKVDERIDRVEQQLHDRLNSHSDRITGVEAQARVLEERTAFIPDDQVKINDLEAKFDKLEGAKGAVEWANRLWPLFAAVIGLVGIYIGLRP